MSPKNPKRAKRSTRVRHLSRHTADPRKADWKRPEVVAARDKKRPWKRKEIA